MRRDGAVRCGAVRWFEVIGYVFVDIDGLDGGEVDLLTGIIVWILVATRFSHLHLT